MQWSAPRFRPRLAPQRISSPWQRLIRRTQRLHGSLHDLRGPRLPMPPSLCQLLRPNCARFPQPGSHDALLASAQRAHLHALSRDAAPESLPQLCLQWLPPPLMPQRIEEPLCSGSSCS